MIGSRIALIVGTSAVAIGGLIGVTLGVLAAFATRLLGRRAGGDARHPHRLPDTLIAMLVVAASDTASKPR